MDCFGRMKEQFSWKMISEYLHCPAVRKYFTTMEEAGFDEEELWNGLKKALEGAIGQFVEHQDAGRGSNLKKDIIEKLTGFWIWWAISRSARRRSWRSTGRSLETKVRELLEDAQIEEKAGLPPRWSYSRIRSCTMKKW